MRGIALIQVGETLEGRHELSRKILLDTLARQALLVLAAAVLAWFAVRFVLRPLMQLTADVEARSPTDLSNFDPDQVHREVRPLVAAMNDYMARLQTLISGQRRFIADASHQLRTPLTVLKTQAELALREKDPQAMRDIVESIARTTDATVHLANRLLTLARAEHGAAVADLQPVSLVETARQVGLELALQAVRKEIDLELDAAGEVMVHANPLLLHELISNLVDNAIRYTASGGRVSLRVSTEGGNRGGAGGCGLLEIEDNGPGIVPGERDKVFLPFYRAASSQATNADGSGLGLTIVRDIAAMHKASIDLSEGIQGAGLKVSVRFPGIVS
jgi:two-component system sensor histidine kinase TctE